ncbi:MAG: hypothetical protein JWM11_4701 [Planctomycetaceae bacterium]|nr:hypothetical protein [Planctomycetaceae bacterium]
MKNMIRSSTSSCQRHWILAGCMFFCSLLTLIGPVWAELKSGPEAGVVVAGFKTIAVTGELAKTPAEEIDYLKARTDRTTVFLFVSAENFQRPIARYLKTLDKSITDGIDGVANVEAVAVWLTDDVQKSKDYLPLAQKSLSFEHTALTVFPGAKQGPDGWGLDTEAHLTTVIVRGGKAVASFAYRSTNETDIPAVLLALKKKP